MAKTECTKALFDEIVEDLYQLVTDCGYPIEAAAKAEANYLENHGIYGFKEMALRHGCKSLRDLYAYGGQLAGDIDAFDAQELATA